MIRTMAVKIQFLREKPNMEKNNPDIFEKYGRTWYKHKKDVLSNRKIGDRLYFDAGMMAYYLITPKKQSFWRF